MNNLLPHEIQQQIKSSYSIRLFWAWVLNFFLLSLIAMLFLTPSFILSKGKKDAITSRLSNAKRDQTIELEKKIKQIIEDSTAKIYAIKKMDTDITSTQVFGIMESIKNIDKSNDIEIVQYDIGKPDKGMRPLSIQGVAKTRSSLTAFSKRLNTNSNFINVDIPISSYEKNTQLPFTAKMNVIDPAHPPVIEDKSSTSSTSGSNKK